MKKRILIFTLILGLVAGSSQPLCAAPERDTTAQAEPVAQKSLLERASNWAWNNKGKMVMGYICLRTLLAIARGAARAKGVTCEVNYGSISEGGIGVEFKLNGNPFIYACNPDSTPPETLKRIFYNTKHIDRAARAMAFFGFPFTQKYMQAMLDNSVVHNRAQDAIASADALYITWLDTLRRLNNPHVPASAA